MEPPERLISSLPISSDSYPVNGNKLFSESPGTLGLLRIDVQLMVSLVLTLVRMLQRVLVLMLIRMLMLQRWMSRVESHASCQRTSSAMGANQAGRVGQLVVLSTKTTEPDESVFGYQHRRACGRRLLVNTANLLLHRCMPAATFGTPQSLYPITVAV